MAIRQPELREVPFIMSVPVHGRMVVSAANALAESQGVSAGMVVADAKTLFPGLEVIDDPPARTEEMLPA
ncbi:MAG TPA: DNA polymerase Y family protein, partial [Sphingobacterium sp.]|nr:DNA polymerase Y family protein [Sphingobacterium sp.]